MSTGLSLPFLGISNQATRLAKYEEIPNLSNYYTKDEIDNKFESDDYSLCKFLLVNNVNATTSLSFSCNFRPLAIFGSSYGYYDGWSNVYEWIEYIETDTIMGKIGYYRLSPFNDDTPYSSSKSYVIFVNYSDNNVTISGFNSIVNSRRFNLIVFG